MAKKRLAIPYPAKHYPAVEIVWIDSRSPTPFWQHTRDMSEPKPVLCTSVGYLVAENKFAITLVQSLGDAELDKTRLQLNGAGDIPVPAIIKRRTLK